ncbi:MAG TPA: hypothetical protein VFL98_00290 [Candidatus Paceibacterota bacterium]|nr:hypothetical protein [Candidatus Paceibacterota bacterium]
MRDFRRRSRAPAYHGDAIRTLFLAAAAGILISIPLSPDAFPLGTPALVSSAIALVIAAVLTAPGRRGVLIADCGLAAAGFLLAEFIAVRGPILAMPGLFLAREALALAFLIALILGAASVRALPRARGD